MAEPAAMVAIEAMKPSAMPMQRKTLQILSHIDWFSFLSISLAISASFSEYF